MDQLLYFTGVVENNSITKTSKAFFVSQPAISSAIKKLEDELGVELLVRNNNEITLTPEGKYFYSLVKPIVTLFLNIPNQMNDFANKHKVIKIGIPPMLGSFIFAPFLDGFISTYPNIKLSMTELGSKANQEAVIKGDIDVALTVIYKGEVNPDLDYLKIGETKLIYSVKKSHPLSSYSSVSIHDIKNYPLILLKEDTLQYKIIMELFAQNNIEPEIRLLSDQISTIKELLKYGNTGAFLFNQVVENDNDIVGIPLANDINFDILVAWKKGNRLSISAQKFIKFITKK